MRFFSARTIAGAIAATIVLFAGCDDDGEDGVDSGTPRDAGMTTRDAGPVATDAGPADTDAGPADTDAGGEATFDLTLTTAAEVPPCEAAADGASGTATVTLDAAGTTITVTDFTFEGLSGPVTAAHIHFGASDVAGPIVFPLEYAPPSDQSFTADDYPSPAPDGAPATFAAFVDAMRAGDTYINVHTGDCAPGEIRAQIE